MGCINPAVKLPSAGPVNFPPRLSKVSPPLLQNPLKALAEPVRAPAPALAPALAPAPSSLARQPAADPLSNPAALVAEAPLEGLSQLAESADTTRQLRDVATATVAPRAESLSPQALSNAQNVFAHAQAQLLASKYL